MSSFLSSLSDAVKATVQGLEASAASALAGEATEVYQLNGRRYVSKRILGSGGYATVYLVELDGQPGREFALKRLVVDSETLELAKREVALWSSIPRHANVVPLLGHGMTRNPAGNREKMVLLLMPLCSGGSLYDEIVARYREKRYFTERQVLQMMEDICSGVAALHAHRPPLIHRDIKVENVLFPSRHDTTAMICDFGSATTRVIRPALVREKALIEEEVQKSTTIPYRAPECIDFFKEYEINEKMDIWALGCVLYKTMYFEDAFTEPLSIVNIRPALPPPAARHFSANLQQLYQWMWTEDPAERPDIFQVLARISALLSKSVSVDALREKYARLYGAVGSVDDYYAQLRSAPADTISQAAPSHDTRRGVSAASLGLFDASSSASRTPSTSTQQRSTPAVAQQPQAALSFFDMASSPTVFPVAPGAPSPASSSSLFPGPSSSPASSSSLFPGPSSSPASSPSLFPGPSSSPASSPSLFPVAPGPSPSVFSQGGSDFFATTTTTTTSSSTFDFFASAQPAATAVDAKATPGQLAAALQQAYRSAFVQCSPHFVKIAGDSWALWEAKPRPAVCSKPLSDSLARVHNQLRARDTVANTRSLADALSGAHAILFAGAPYVLDKAFADGWDSNFDTIAQRLAGARSSTAASQALGRYASWLSQKLAFQRKHRDLFGCLAPRSFSKFDTSPAELADVLAEIGQLHAAVHDVANAAVHSTELHACLNPLLAESAALFALSLRLLVALGQKSQQPGDAARHDAIAAVVLRNCNSLRSFAASCASLAVVAQQLTAVAIFAASSPSLDAASLRAVHADDLPFPPLPDLAAAPPSPALLLLPAASASPTFPFPAAAPLSFWDTNSAPAAPPAAADLLSLGGSNQPMPDSFFSIPSQPPVPAQFQSFGYAAQPMMGYQQYYRQ